MNLELLANHFFSKESQGSFFRDKKSFCFERRGCCEMEEVPVTAAQAFEAAMLAVIERSASVAKLGCGSAEERRRVDGE